MLKSLKSVTKDSFYYSIANMMNKIIGFVLLPLYSRYFSISEYGLLALFDTIIDFMVIFSSLGILEAFKRWYWDDDDKERQKTVFTTVITFSFVTALIFSGIILLILMKYSVFIFGVELSGKLITTFVISIILNIVVQRLLILLRTKRLAKSNMTYNAVRAIFTCIATVIYITQLNAGIESVFIGRIIGISITLLFLIPVFRRNINFRFDFSLLGKMIQFSYPLAISGTINLIFTLSDRWILSSLSTLDDVGQYSLAYRITNLLRFLVINAFMQAYVFSFFQKMHDLKQYNFFKKSVTYFVLTIMAVGLLLVGFSRELIMLLAENKDYQESYTIIPILMMAILFSGLRQVLVLPFYKHKQTKYIAFVSATAGLLNIGLNFLLIPVWKSYGAAATTVFAHLCVDIAYYLKAKKFKEFSYEIGRILKIFVPGVIYIILIVFLNEFPVGWGTLSKLLLVLSYPFLLYSLGFFAEKELIYTRNFFLKIFNINKFWNK